MGFLKNKGDISTTNVGVSELRNVDFFLIDGL